MSDEDVYVVEATVEQDVLTLSAEPFATEILTVGWDAFPSDRDLPSAGDRVTVAGSRQVQRGTVLGYAVVLELDS